MGDMLIINADDWGRDRVSTDTALACYEQRRISSASAMVFMEDSERGAELARSAGIDVGLHINFTQKFNGPSCSEQLLREQDGIRRFLLSSKYALIVYNPFLKGHFRRVFEAQLAEFVRIYGHSPSHFDGHQHMHLSTNMLFQKVIPHGAKVRRSFSFRSGEKGAVNRAYRRWVDGRLARDYRLADFFFSLARHLEPGKLEALLGLAREAKVELMTHAWNRPEYDWLMSDAFPALTRELETGSYARV